MFSNIFKFCIFVIVFINFSQCEREYPTIDAITTLYQPSEVDPSNNNGHISSHVFHCGLDTKDGMLDHTWLVRLKYDNDEYGCGGVLITSRYVLTAASCVSGDAVLKLGEVKSVALRQNFGDRLFVDYEIEKIIKHSKHVPNDIHGQNDVALIRLAKIINRRTSTQICLDPSRHNVGDLYVEGWGQTLDGQKSNERELLQLEFVDSSTCQERLSQHEYQVTPADLCTTFKDNDTNRTCPVDGGGVLLRETRSKWFLIGIASFNTQCGTTAMPGIFTRLAQINDWIGNNMNP